MWISRLPNRLYELYTNVSFIIVSSDSNSFGCTATEAPDIRKLFPIDVVGSYVDSSLRSDHLSILIRRDYPFYLSRWIRGITPFIYCGGYGGYFFYLMRWLRRRMFGPNMYVELEKQKQIDILISGARGDFNKNLRKWRYAFRQCRPSVSLVETLKGTNSVAE